jgi:hypothetical protein
MKQTVVDANLPQLHIKLNTVFIPIGRQTYKGLAVRTPNPNVLQIIYSGFLRYWRKGIGRPLAS